MNTTAPPCLVLLPLLPLLKIQLQLFLLLVLFPFLLLPFLLLLVLVLSLLFTFSSSPPSTCLASFSSSCNYYSPFCLWLPQLGVLPVLLFPISFILLILLPLCNHPSLHYSAPAWYPPPLHTGNFEFPFFSGCNIPPSPPAWHPSALPPWFSFAHFCSQLLVSTSSSSSSSSSSSTLLFSSCLFFHVLPFLPPPWTAFVVIIVQSFLSSLLNKLINGCMLAGCKFCNGKY